MTLPLYAPAFAVSLIPNHYWIAATVAVGGGGGGGTVRVFCSVEGAFAGCAGRVTEVLIGGVERAGAGGGGGVAVKGIWLSAEVIVGGERWERWRWRWKWGGSGRCVRV